MSSLFAVPAMAAVAAVRYPGTQKLTLETQQQQLQQQRRDNQGQLAEQRKVEASQPHSEEMTRSFKQNERSLLVYRNGWRSWYNPFSKLQ